MSDHPCFTCALPDCDEASSGCAIRQLRNSYARKMKLRQPVTELERIASREWHREYVSAQREAAE